MSEGLLLEAQRVERTIARIRWGAAALDIVLGPFFPNLSLPGVFLLGAAIVVYGALVLRASGRATSIEQHRGIAAISFACDLTVLVVALFLFSSDPGWITYLVATVVIITGAFRFGSVGAWSAAGVSMAGYVAVAVFRQLAFGFVTPAERALFTVSVFALTAVLLDRGLRELRQLRDEREGLITGLQRRVAEDAALEQVMRIVAGIPSADAIVPAVLRASRDVLRFDRATVFVADEELGEYRARYPSPVTKRPRPSRPRDSGSGRVSSARRCGASRPCSFATSSPIRDTSRAAPTSSRDRWSSCRCGCAGVPSPRSRCHGRCLMRSARTTSAWPRPSRA